MVIEDQLKNLILSRYRSIREFTLIIDMPYTTIDSIFRRGIGNSSVANVIKICKALGISADGLADGKIVPYHQAPRGSISEVRDIVNATKAKLFCSHLTIDGVNIEAEQVEPIIDALDVGYEMAKKKAKIATSSAADLSQNA